MKVRDLMKKLLEVKDLDMEVFVTSNTGEYQYASANSCGEQGIYLDNDYDEENEVIVFVVDEE